MTEDYLARCPYYMYDNGRTVCCEGMCEGMHMIISFCMPGIKHKHKKKFCRGKWASCPWAQAQNRHYDYSPPLR